MKPLAAASMILTTLCLAVLVQPACASDWTKYDGNPIVTGVSPVGTPAVLKIGDTYKMWYEDNWDIALATSSDGLHWAKYGTVFTAPVQGALGNVLYDGSGYKMWYSDAGRSGYAISSNGVSWTNQGFLTWPSQTYDAYAAEDPFVLYDQSAGLYKMWYQAGASASVGRTIAYATSTNGTTWSKQGVVLTPQPGYWGIGSPYVEKTSGGYNMWFGGGPQAGPGRITRIDSSDGINWDTTTGKVELEVGPSGQWDSKGVGAPYVINGPNNQRLLYYAGTGTQAGNTEAIGVATYQQPRTHVLSVGVRYDGADPGIPWETLAADLLAEHIQSAFAGFRSVRTNNLLKLNAANADNRAQIKSALDNMYDKVAPGDTFVFYIGSHGSLNLTNFIGDDDEAPVSVRIDDQDKTNRANSTADEYVHLTRTAPVDDGEQQLKDDWLSGLFVDPGHPKWEEVNKLFIIDACFTGGFWGSTEFGDTGDLARLSKAALISACAEGEFGYTVSDVLTTMQMNALGYSLVRALGNLRWRDMVTYEELFDAIKLEGSGLDGAPGFIAGWEENWNQPVTVETSFSQNSSQDFEMTLGIPEPTTLSLLALGALAVLRRKRR